MSLSLMLRKASCKEKACLLSQPDQAKADRLDLPEGPWLLDPHCIYKSEQCNCEFHSGDVASGWRMAMVSSRSQAILRPADMGIESTRLSFM